MQLVEASDRDDLIARLSTSFAGGKPPDALPHQLPLLRPVRGAGRARAAAEPRLEQSDVFEEDDFYAEALDAFRFGRRPQILPAAEHLEPRRLLQPRPVRGRGRAGARGRLDLEGHGRPTAQRADEGHERRRHDRRQYGLGRRAERSSGSRPSSGRTAASSSTTRTPTRLRPSRHPRRPRRSRQFFALRVDVRRHPERGGARVGGRRGPLPSTAGRRWCFARAASTPGFRTITDFDWDVAPLPRFERTGRRSCTPTPTACRAASENKDAAWRFVEFALGPEGQRITAESRAHGPVAQGRRELGRLPRPEREAGRTRRSSSTPSRTSGACRASRPGRRSRTPPGSSSKRRCTTRRAAERDRRGSSIEATRGRLRPSGAVAWPPRASTASASGTARSTRCAGLDLEVGRRRAARPRRPVRLGQVDRAADRGRPRGARRRDASASAGRDVTRLRAGGAQRVDGLPELRAVPAPDRGREHRLRPRGRAACRGTRRASASRGGRRRRRLRGAARRAGRASCRAASASASRSRARSSASPTSSCSTSRSRTSTRSCASRCAPS